MKNRRVRLIRKREPQAAPEISGKPVDSIRPEPSEREIKTVVSRWVEDHRQRAEEFRRSLAASLQAGELNLPTR